MKRRLGNRGVTAVEFAFIAPLALATAAGLIEVAAQATVAAALDHAARRASRMGVTGSIDGSGATAPDAQRVEALKAAVLGSSGGLLADANLTLKLSSYNTVADATTGSNKAAGPGGAGKLVRYDLEYTQPLLTSRFSGELFPQTQFKHTSTILVKNEPFPTN